MRIILRQGRKLIERRKKEDKLILRNLTFLHEQ